MSEPVVYVRNLSKAFGDFPAVADVSFDVDAGEVFALLGPNGAGKTTTIRMLMGILRPSAGAASVAGMDCFADSVPVKRLLGYLPDEPTFYDYLRGRELLQFVGRMHGLPDARADARIGQLAERLALAEDLEEYAVNYSRGMKKKLALICALLHEPEVLILDEPTNGLDPYATRAVHELIRQQAADGKSLLFSTHLLDQAEKLCDRVGILHKGSLAAVGPMDDLRARLTEGGTLEEVFFAVTGGDEPPGREAPQ